MARLCVHGTEHSRCIRVGKFIGHRSFSRTLPHGESHLIFSYTKCRNFHWWCPSRDSTCYLPQSLPLGLDILFFNQIYKGFMTTQYNSMVGEPERSILHGHDPEAVPSTFVRITLTLSYHLRILPGELPERFPYLISGCISCFTNTIHILFPLYFILMPLGDRHK